jgi:hypothetical protein
MLRLMLILLILCGVGAVMAIKYLPLWQVAIGAVVFLIIARYLGGYLLKQLFLAPFKAKGAVLRGAKVDVHSIVPTSKPADLNEDPEEAQELKNARFFALDVTINPQNNPGPFRSYDPSEISLVEFGKAISVDDNDDETSLGDVVKVEVFHNGTYHPYDENAPESNRLRLIARVKPGPRKLAFRYYFESFGEIVVPAA